MLNGGFSLGFWRLGDSNLSYHETETLIKTAIDNGISVMDHADIYGEYKCEELFGQVLKKNPNLRNKVQLITKCGIKFACDFAPQNVVKHYDLSTKSITTSVDHSLSNLGVEIIDLLLVHRPSPIMDVEEIADTFLNLQKVGKVKSFGVSNFTSSQFELLQSKIQLETNQIEFSVLQNQAMYDGTLDSLIKHNIRPMAWSPLAGGVLFNPKTVVEHRVVAQLELLSSKYNSSVEQIALAWILKHPCKIMPILGTQNITRLLNSIKAQNIELELQDWFKILEVVNGYPAP